MDKIEIYENNDSTVRFYISYSDKKISTGILVLQPNTSLSKHNRPLAIENDTQIAGSCAMTLFEEDKEKNIELKPGKGIQIPKGQYHIHSNPFNEVSVALWKAEGDITEIIDDIRKTFKKLPSNFQ